MFKIGDFSKISQVSIKTLHHYDEIGLLKPVRVESSSGYRYYALDQLPRLNRILALKDLGFSLEQIALLLNEPLAPAELRGMLRLKQAELQQLVQKEQARLQRIEARLKQIEQEDFLPTYDIVLKSLPPQMLACGRIIIPTSEEASKRCEELGISICQLLEQRNLKISGPMCTIYHDELYTGQDQNLDIEMGFGIETEALHAILPARSGISIRELSGVDLAASLVHRGSYEGLWQAYGYILSWIENNGYQRAGPFRFVYLRTPPSAEEPITEVQFPIAEMLAS